MNMHRYLARQAKHPADHPDVEFNFQVLEQNIPKADLDRYEHFYIHAFGGPTLPSGRIIGELSNARNQMVWWRCMAAGGDGGIP
jgi:hypothetical protein